MAHWFYVTLQSCKWYISVFFFLKFYTEFIYVQKYLVFIILSIACRNLLCNWEIEIWMKATLSWIKNTVFCPEFSPQNAENCILGALKFQNFLEKQYLIKLHQSLAPLCHTHNPAQQINNVA